MYVINLSDLDILQCYFEICFQQFNVVVEFEFWQEVFCSVEDIYIFFNLSKCFFKNIMMVNYYEKFICIFFVGENYLFYVVVWFCYYNLFCQFVVIVVVGGKKFENFLISEVDFQKVVIFVVFLVLFIFVISIFCFCGVMVDFDEVCKNKNLCFIYFFGMFQVFICVFFFCDVLFKFLICCCCFEICDFYNIFEVDFYFFLICKKIFFILVKIGVDEEM